MASPDPPESRNFFHLDIVFPMKNCCGIVKLNFRGKMFPTEEQSLVNFRAATGLKFYKMKRLSRFCINNQCFALT